MQDSSKGNKAMTRFKTVREENNARDPWVPFALR
jgi:hypothetical protein